LPNADKFSKNLSLLKGCTVVCTTVQKMVIEIGMEQTRLFQFKQCSTMTIFVTEIAIDFSEPVSQCRKSAEPSWFFFREVTST